MIRSELSAKLAAQLDTTQLEADRIVLAFTSAIIKGCKDDGKVNIKGFGVFKVKVAKSRTIHNPFSRGDQFVPEKNKIHFQPFKNLKAMVNDGAHRNTDHHSQPENPQVSSHPAD